jgi:NADH-quinone oxidoreductase subunit E
MEIAVDMSQIDSIVDSYNSEKAMLIPILQDIQAQYNHLPRQALIHLSKKLALPLSHIFHVATFFKAFSLTPRGRHKISVCLGTACHVRGGKRILERIERDLNVKEGETTEDLRFTVETVRCIGCCSLAPAITIDEETHGRLVQDKLKKIYKEYE